DQGRVDQGRARGGRRGHDGERGSAVSSTETTTASAPAADPTDRAMVRLERVTRTFTSSAGPVHALRDVSLDVDEGELVALVGRSGSGKTTLLNCLGGLDTPTSGRVVVGSTVISEADERTRTALRR